MSRVEFLNSEVVVSGDGRGKTRFWNIKDGTEAQASMAGDKFSFSKVAVTKQQVGRHLITADGDLVLVHETTISLSRNSTRDTELLRTISCLSSVLVSHLMTSS